MIKPKIDPVEDPSVKNILKDLNIDVDFLRDMINNGPASATHYFENGVALYAKEEDGVWWQWDGGYWIEFNEGAAIRSLNDARAIVAMHDLQPSLNVKRFEMRHNCFRDSKPQYFTELNAPKWLTSEDTIEGSTMDDRWFWKDHVLTLEVGASVDTDFQTITRLG